jgi:hypothetical protein
MVEETSDLYDDEPTIACTECGDLMRLVGIERDTQNTQLL